ncbi:hypothetical protein VM1G_06314 [Cytospora mali]|uniref:Uncharacterized protein n=1 Tax=Cytospora mali TaxID=578113 RepID=A0A194W2B4_CYTMA|nr:hypothetical protein VM1G_06314 [Valsa mali]
MSGFTKEERSIGWNVLIYFNEDEAKFTGIWQSKDVVRVVDMVHDLELCFVFEAPGPDATVWQPALLRKSINPTGSTLIVLDAQDRRAIPTPASDQEDRYFYVFHSSQCTR